MGKRAPKIPEGYKYEQTGTNYQVADVDIGPGGYDFRDVSKEQYDYETGRETQYDEVGGRVGKPAYDTREVPIWSLVPKQQQARAPAPAPPPAPRAASAPRPSAGGPQPPTVSAPSTPAAPKVQKVEPQPAVYGTDAQAGAATGAVFGTKGRRPFRRAPQQRSGTEALTKKTKLGG